MLTVNAFSVFPGKFPGKSRKLMISREIFREKPKINDFPGKFPGKSRKLMIFPGNFPGKVNVERIFKIVTLD